MLSMVNSNWIIIGGLMTAILSIIALVACIGILVWLLFKLILKIEDISTRNLMIEAMGKGNAPLAQKLAGIAANKPVPNPVVPLKNKQDLHTSSAGLTIKQRL